MLRAPDRAVHLNEKLDTAGIVFSQGDLPFPVDALSLMTEGRHLKRGVEIGWLGFPAVAPNELCFFSGHTSAYLDHDQTYLVDGVAINGVSGGPAFECLQKSFRVIGVISAYIPNRATGEVLPGVAVVRDVTQFQDLAKRFKNFDDAKAKETPADQPPPPVPEGELAPSPSPTAGITSRRM